MQFVITSSDLISSKMPNRVTSNTTIMRHDAFVKIVNINDIKNSVIEEFSDKLAKNILMTKSVLISEEDNIVKDMVVRNLKVVNDIVNLIKNYSEDGYKLIQRTVESYEERYFRMCGSIIITDLLNSLRISTIHIKSLKDFINALKYILNNKYTYGATIELSQSDNNDTFSTFNLFSHTINKNLIIDKIFNGEHININYYRIDPETVKSIYKSGPLLKSLEILHCMIKDGIVEKLEELYSLLTLQFISKDYQHKYKLVPLFSIFNDINFDNIKVVNVKINNNGKVMLELTLPINIDKLKKIKTFVIEPQTDVNRTIMNPGYGVFSFSVDSKDTSMPRYTSYHSLCVKDIKTEYDGPIYNMTNMSTLSTPNLSLRNNVNNKDVSICLGSMKYTKYNVYVLRDRNYDSPFYKPYLTPVDVAIMKAQMLYHINDYLKLIKKKKEEAAT